MDNDKKLNILWSTDNPITAEFMVLLYATNGMKRHLWEEIQVIIWGASAKLAAENKHIQDLIATAKEAGVKFTVCAGCADKLGTRQALLELGIEGKLRSGLLTEIIKKKENLITL